MYDLILKNGNLLDPSQNLRGVQDIAVEKGLIARIGPNLPEAEARRVVDVRDCLVTAGLVDIHVHVLSGFTRLGADPDLVGVYAGVTTIADAGSAGCNSWAGFVNYIIPKAKTELFAFLNVGSDGMVSFPEVTSERDIEVDRTVRVVSANREWIKGIKLRMTDPMLSLMGLEACKKAVQMARDSGTRLMVHIGDHQGKYPHALVRQMLDLLAPGDTVTHIWAGGHNTALDEQGKLIPELLDAQKRGVWMDVGHGQGHVDYDVVKKVTDQGLLPQSISTDISRPGRVRTVHSMVEMMARSLALGFSLEDTVIWSTTNPARALGEEGRLGSLAVGRQADISVLRLVEGRWLLRDTSGGAIPASQMVLPVLTVKRGVEYHSEYGPRPWGWLPDSADQPLPAIPAFNDPRFD